MDAHRNPPATVDESTLAVRRTIRIEAPPDRVWSLIAEPSEISRWFGRTELDGTGPGAAGTMTFEDGRPIPLRIAAIDPGRSVSYSWNNDGRAGSDRSFDQTTATTFTFSIAALDGGTVLEVVETGFENTSDPTGNLRSHRGGWTDELDELVRVAEADR